MPPLRAPAGGPGCCHADANRCGDATSPRVWRGLDAAGEPAPEFASPFDFPEASRREALRIMAASLALAAAGCGDASAPAKPALPYVVQPEQQVAGRPRFYATATLFEGFAQPVIVETHEGRPTKIEGNPDHPVANAGTDAFMQAAVLQFYDPDRSQTVRQRGVIATWAAAEAALADLRRQWDRSGGAGLRLLSGAVTSPTLNRQLDRLLQRWPQARWHGFEPVGNGWRDEAVRHALGRDAALHYALDRADVVVALDDDLLGAGPQQVGNAGRWAARRRAAAAGDGACTLHVAEPTPTLTGARAKARLPVAAAQIPVLATALANRLGLAEAPAVRLAPVEQAWVWAAADDLLAAGPRALVAVGPCQPPEVQALSLAINAAIGGWGRTLFCTEAIARPIGEAESFDALVADMAAGAVETLVILDANPVYASFADRDFAALMRRVPVRLHAGLFHDETAAEADWHLPLSHPLESWSDARAADGTATVIQPTISPLYDTRSIHEVFALLLAELPADGRSIVAATWASVLAEGEVDPRVQEERWRDILRAGFVAGSAPPALTVAPGSQPPVTAGAVVAPADGGIEVVFRPDPTAWDGRFANCTWLQELPKPLTKLTWDNVAAVSPALAAERAIANGELITIEDGGNRLEAPAWILPGQAERTVTLFLGYGRTRAGRVGDGIGYNAYLLRRSDAPWRIAGAAVAPTGKRAALATTQTHGTVEGHAIVRLVPPADARATVAGETNRPMPSLYPPAEPGGYAWAMAIDLDQCIGCNACVLACQAENNVPSVGKQQVALGREMHWLRIDRYYAGSADDPATHFMPVPCMHCEKAPCEMGCPVNATVHGNGGINEMIYNRCIGTRTCSSYCPYKVRRFNWLDFTRTAPPSIQAQRNPDVTVRDRGVMEKCTYCIQRIAAANASARVDNRGIGDGEVIPACQAACPTSAIMFGDSADAASRISGWRRGPRNYALLEHLGTRPRTTYLARIADAGRAGEG